MRLYGPRDTTPDARAILAALAGVEVEFVLIGGFAANAHGLPRLAEAVDVLVASGRLNSARLAEAIAALSNSDAPAPPIRSDGVTRFDTDRGALRVHRSLDGVRAPYDELARRATAVEVGELHVRVLGYDDLIRTKRATAGSQDLADIGTLEEAHRSA